MRDVPNGSDLSKLSTEALMKMKGSDEADGTGTFGQNVAAGVGKAFVDLGRGAKQILDVPARYLESKFEPKNLSSLVTGEQRPTSMAGRIGEMLGMPTAVRSAAATQAEVDESRITDAPLMKTGGGITGNILGNVAATVALPGANTYSGAATIGALLGAAQPTATGESRAVNTATGAVLGQVAKGVGDAIGGAVAKRLASTTASGTQKLSQNAAKDAVLSAGRAEGYVVPPSQANPSAWNSLLEGISGKIKTGQVASQKNQVVTDRLARQAIGMADDAPITSEALKAVRTQAGRAYKDIEAIGTYATDRTFKDAIGSLAASAKTLAKEIPELADDKVLALVKSLDKPSFEGGTVIAAMKAMREKAATAFRNGETDAGRFYRGASEAMEDLVERNLMQTGQEGLLGAFRDARQLIAKTYTIEGALSGSNVSAPKLAAQLRKGKPLSGGLEKSAQFAQQFPKAAQDIKESVPMTSPLDWYAATGTSLATGNPFPLALAGARPTLRSLMLSDLYQSANKPSYGPGASMRVMDLIANNPATRRALPGLGAAGALQVNQQ